MIDISPGMVERSRRKAPTHEGALDARVAATVCSESVLLARGPLDWEGSVR